MALILALLCVTTVWTDLHYRKVPNLVVAGALVAGLAWLPFAAGGALAPASRLIGFAVGLAVMLPAYLLGRMGAGDVKFFAVVGMFIGPYALLPVWVMGGLLAFAHACAALLWRRAPWADWVLIRLGDWRARIGLSPDAGAAALDAGRGLPYAAYLAIGVLLWLSAAEPRI